MSEFVGTHGSGAAASNLPGPKQGKYYVTTAIAYMNGYPHIGHAYEFMTADIIARYYRVFGYDTFFLTGADEHGQKVAASAEKANRTPKEHCDLYVQSFQDLNQKLNISYDRYIRTTDSDHQVTAQMLWKLCAEKGDIYLDTYEGWYNEREEVFVTDSEAEATNFLDSGSGLPLKRVKEESYFFRMSAYCEKLIAYIEENPLFIQPDQYRNNILARLKKGGLKDLSVSRTSFSWGINVPEGFDSKHVMYVWFDALSNYLSGVHALDSENSLAPYWPASKHIIGKDIIWFHCVIWPCILMSAGVSLPEGVYSHGFVNAADGRKMSKSYNNTIDPYEVLNKFSSDSLRYYCCCAATYGSDLNFSEPGLIAMHNSELADILGNLVNRALNLCAKYCDGKIPETVHDAAFNLPFDMKELISTVTEDLASCSINTAVFRGMEAARATNRYLTEAEPWKMKGSDEARRPAIVRTTLEAVYAFMHVLAPVIPIAAESVFTKLGTPAVHMNTLKHDFYNLAPGTPISIGDILFKKIEVEAAAPVAKPEPKPKKEPTPVVEEDPNQCDFTKMDIRVGRIVKVWNHETADRLFCEEIDIGGEIRQVASGLRQFYTLEDMQDRLVLVICNLKEAKIQGFVSAGMVLAAKSADGSQLELLCPPVDAAVGDRILVEGEGGEPLSVARLKKLKIWEKVAVDLKTNENCEACWKDKAMCLADGRKCTVKSLANAQIS